MVFVQVIAGLVYIALILKLYEIALSVRWAFKTGRAFSAELAQARTKWLKSSFDSEELKRIMEAHDRKWSPTEWPITRFLFRTPNPIRGMITNFVFRWPSLMLLATVVAVYVPYPEVAWYAIPLLIIGVWLEIVHVVSNRLLMGPEGDYFVRTVEVIAIDPFPQPAAKELNPWRTDVVRLYFSILAWVVAVSLFAYAGVYCGLCHIAGAHVVFEGLHQDWRLPFEALYLSAMTFLGGGEISIRPVHLASQLVVMSQLLAAASLLIFLLSAFALTVGGTESLSLEKSKGKRKPKDSLPPAEPLVTVESVVTGVLKEKTTNTSPKEQRRKKLRASSGS